MTYETLHVTLWPAVWLHNLHLTSHLLEHLQKVSFGLSAPKGRVVPEPVTILANTSEVADGDSNTTYRMSAQLTLSSAYCYKWMELKPGYPPISLSSTMTPGPTLCHRKEPVLQAKQGWRPMPEK